MRYWYELKEPLKLSAFFILFIFGIALVYGLTLKDDRSVLDKRLYEMGYPEKGMIVHNNTIKFPGGVMVITKNGYIEQKLNVTLYEAWRRAKEYIDERNKEFEEIEKQNRGVRLPRYRILPETAEEVYELGRYWWRFQVRQDRYTVGWIYVARDNPNVIKFRSVL